MLNLALTGQSKGSPPRYVTVARPCIHKQKFFDIFLMAFVWPANQREVPSGLEQWNEATFNLICKAPYPQTKVGATFLTSFLMTFVWIGQSKGTNPQGFHEEPATGQIDQLWTQQKPHANLPQTLTNPLNPPPPPSQVPETVEMKQPNYELTWQGSVSTNITPALSPLPCRGMITKREGSSGWYLISSPGELHPNKIFEAIHHDPLTKGVMWNT